MSERYKRFIVYIDIRHEVFSSEQTECNGEKKVKEREWRIDLYRRTRQNRVLYIENDSKVI